VFEHVFDKERGRFYIRSVKLEGAADFIVHRLKEFNKFLSLGLAVVYIFLDYFGIHF
jgi:hypothetical protein